MENWKTRKSKRFYCRQRVRKLETCLSLSCDLIVQAVEVLGGGAVHVEPPVADEVLLLEQGAVGAEERELGETGVAVVGADVERLALRLGVAVVTTVHLAVAGERGLRNGGKDGVVLPWNAWNSIFKGTGVNARSSKVRRSSKRPRRTCRGILVKSSSGCPAKTLVRESQGGRDNYCKTYVRAYMETNAVT